jgi:hypothetical protein
MFRRLIDSLLLLLYKPFPLFLKPRAPPGEVTPRSLSYQLITSRNISASQGKGEFTMPTPGTKPEIWNNADDEREVFQLLGIAASDVNQQTLVRGVRKAIGKLVAANLEIVKALQGPGSGDLDQARIWLEEIPGDEPPRCELPAR